MNLIPLDSDPNHWFFVVSGTVIAIAIVIAAYRVFRGPSLPDRVIGLDMIGVFAVAMLCVFAIASHNRTFLSVGMVAALIQFLGTAAFAIYIERRGPDEEKTTDGGEAAQ